METTENRNPKITRQSPLTFYLRTLLYMFMALLMRVVAFLPLGALFLFPDGSQWRWLAVLCPVLLIFFIFPQRFSFAQALVQGEHERHFSFDRATGVSNYGEKLGESIVQALHIVKWGIPLGMMLGAMYYFYNNIDAISLMKGVGDMGAGVVAVWCAVANFFISIFGGTQLVPNGGLMEGIYTVGAILAVGLLILMWGVMRNSAYRYIWALATRLEKNPRAEARRRLRGRRWKQFWVAMINLVLWTPALFVVFTTLKGVIRDFSEMLFKFVTTNQMSVPELSNSLQPLIFAFLVCYMPLLPVRRILTAFFATKQLRYAPTVLETVPPEEDTNQVTTTSSGASIPAWETPVSQPQAPAYAPVYSTTEPAKKAEPTSTVAAAYPVQEPVLKPEPVYQPYTQAQEPIPTREPVAAYRPFHAPEPVAEEEQAEPEAPATEPEEARQPEAYRQTEPLYQAAQPTVAAPVAEPEPMVNPEPEPTAIPEAEPVAAVAQPAPAPVAEAPVAADERPVTAEPAARWDASALDDDRSDSTDE